MKNGVGILFLFCTILVISQNRIDTVAFQNKTRESTENNVYNSTHYELQKFKAFKLKTSKIKDKQKYLSEIHSFTKDSLQILAVKLISIKELNTKNLLAKDLSQNKNFYITFLEELKESEINPNEYLFLENMLTKMAISEVASKYAYSKWLNIILALSLIGLLIFTYNTNRKKTPAFSLSSRNYRQKLDFKRKI